MPSPTEHIGLGRQLGRRLLPVTLAMVLLISLGLPAIYFFVESSALRRASTIHARNLAVEIQEVVLLAPTLWKYQTHKLEETLEKFVKKDITLLRILDDGGRTVAQHEVDAGRTGAWWNGSDPTGRAPLTFNGRAIGMVEVSVALAPLLNASLVLLLFSMSLGVGLGVIAFSYPVRVATGMEQKIEDLIDAVQRSRVETERVNVQLEERVSERTTQLSQREQELRQANEVLDQAKEEAERASRAKSEFLSRMSHELRTPLNAILGFAQLLEMDSPTADARESIDQILKGGQHLLELINEILDIARIEAGRLTVSVEPVAVAELVGETLDLIRPVATYRGVRLETEGTVEEDWRVLADWLRLKQVLLNLLSNAVKYNRRGGRVVLAYVEDRPGWLRVSVRDTGPGIPPEKISRLFIPFERLGLQKSEVEGTGIGLALSKSLVELMGGDIGVESRVGEGSTFWVELPLAERSLAASVPE